MVKDDGYVRFHCRACGQRLKVKSSYEGGNIVPCPRCGVEVVVPLANIRAIAQAADIPETGQPGRLNVDPDLLLERLKGEGEKASGPGSVGGPPTLRQTWSPKAFARLKELDQLAAALAKIEEDVMGQIQRAYRNADAPPEEREIQVRQAAEGRLEEIKQLISARLATIQQQMRVLQLKGRLAPPEQETLERLRRSYEAIQLYGRYVLGVQA